MDKEALVAAGLDYDDGVRRCGGSADFYEKLLEMFLEDPNMGEAREKLAAGDFKGLFGNIHEIKGMSGNLSISSLYQASSQVVELLRADDNEAAAKLFAEMEKAYDTAVAAIKAQSAGE